MLASRLTMHASEMERLVERLVANPHDQEALASAHDAGTRDPQSYASFLEKVGTLTPDPAYASHWLSEAANVWSVTLGDAHRAARILMLAVDKDPTQETAADRLAQLYRENGEHKALVALLERRAKALTQLAAHNPEMRAQLATIHEELGRVWSEAPLAAPKKAMESFVKAIELDSSSAYAIYGLRELYKQAQQWVDAIPLYSMEQATVEEPERKIALYRDEAQVRKLAGDRQGATEVLRQARAIDAEDPGLMQEFAASILERLQIGESASREERDEAVAIFVRLSESYPGEHGYAYSNAALDIDPGHDRAMQLAAFYGDPLGHGAVLLPRWKAYLAANPEGPLADEARARVGNGVTGGDRSAAASYAEQGTVAPYAVAPDGGSSATRAPATVAYMLDEAAALVSRAQRNQALAKYREVLAIEPANPDALAWVEDYLRQRRQYADLRDVLLNAARVDAQDEGTRKQQLLEVAGLCESQLRDLETAIQAWKQICQMDPSDPVGPENLRRLLERGARWDELATLMEQEAQAAVDIEQKVAIEKKLAHLHEVKRKDAVAAGEAWARIAGLLTGDETAIQSAVKLFDKGQRRDLAAAVIFDNAGAVEDGPTRSSLFQRLGELRERAGELNEAGEAYVQAAEACPQLKLWEAAERGLTAASQWERAAYAVGQQAELTSDERSKAAILGRAAELLEKGNDPANALLYYEGAASLDPRNETYAAAVQERYLQAGRHADLAEFLLTRAGRLDEPRARLALRKQAAKIQDEELGDKEAARDTLIRSLDDGDDADILAVLADDAEERGDPGQAREFLVRLQSILKAPEDRTRVAFREATLLSEALEDVDGAIARYHWVLEKVDPKNVEALRRIADLELKRENHAGVAKALERELAISEKDSDKLEVARKLADLYEGPLDAPGDAVKALELVIKLDPEDYEATARLEALCEKIEAWPRVADLLRILADIEGDEEELSAVTLRLAEVLDSKLGRAEDALATVLSVADTGDGACRDAYVVLGDRLGMDATVAAKLVEWYAEASASPTRNEALRGAFDRFLAAGRKPDAAKVAVELAQSKGADTEIAEQLETLAVELKDIDALSVAHGLLAKERSGIERATEFVRQAEVLLRAGVDPVEAQQHGESALGSVSPSEVGPLLERLAALTEDPARIIEIYENQVSRCKAPADRLKALCRAAQVAAAEGQPEKAQSFFELALSISTQDETLSELEDGARRADIVDPDGNLRLLLATAMAGGGHAARDGGRTRGMLLRRAAQLAYRELKDPDKAFQWFSEALIAHVEPATLDALEELAAELGDLRRAEQTLGKALSEVFDGPLVRQLLARRVKLRREKLNEVQGAAEDLKKLHDLAPSDTGVMEELSELLVELGDYRGMVHVLEDQILRGKDPATRSELARKVARLWEEKLADPREAADAWRRVLRMKPNDPEAQGGLERAKSGMLKHEGKDGAGSGSHKAAPAQMAAKSSIDIKVPLSPSSTDTDEDDAKAGLAPAHEGETDEHEKTESKDEAVQLTAGSKDEVAPSGEGSKDEVAPSGEGLKAEASGEGSKDEVAPSGEGLKAGASGEGLKAVASGEGLKAGASGEGLRDEVAPSGEGPKAAPSGEGSANEIVQRAQDSKEKAAPAPAEAPPAVAAVSVVASRLPVLPKSVGSKPKGSWDPSVKRVEPVTLAHAGETDSRQEPASAPRIAPTPPPPPPPLARSRPMTVETDETEEIEGPVLDADFDGDSDILVEEAEEIVEEADEPVRAAPPPPPPAHAPPAPPPPPFAVRISAPPPKKG